MSTPQDPGGPHPDGIPPSKTMAAWALGLCMFGCFTITWVVGVVLAIVVLAESSREGRDRGRGMAIGALVSAGCWVVVLVIYVAASVASPDTDAGETPSDPGTVVDAVTGEDLPRVVPSKLRLGDCFNDPALANQGPATMVTLVPCDRLHDVEVYNIIELEGDAYPGLKKVRHAADEGCASAFEPCVGSPYARSLLEFWYYYPTNSSWKHLSDRAIKCVVGEAGAQTPGSLRDARK